MVLKASQAARRLSRNQASADAMRSSTASANAGASGATTGAPVITRPTPPWRVRAAG
jgi:hypothetical protein